MWACASSVMPCSLYAAGFKAHQPRSKLCVSFPASVCVWVGELKATERVSRLIHGQTQHWVHTYNQPLVYTGFRAWLQPRVDIHKNSQRFIVSIEQSQLWQINLTCLIFKRNLASSSFSVIWTQNGCLTSVTYKYQMSKWFSEFLF